MGILESVLAERTMSAWLCRGQKAVESEVEYNRKEDRTDNLLRSSSPVRAPKVLKTLIFEKTLFLIALCPKWKNSQETSSLMNTIINFRTNLCCLSIAVVIWPPQTTHEHKPTLENFCINNTPELIYQLFTSICHIDN